MEQKDTKSVDELTLRILTILKLDSQSLRDRVVNYFPEYVTILAMKRTREHFKDLFRNKYDSIPFEDLRRCGQEVIVELHRFYSKMADLRWYLFHTEDMPVRIEDRLRYEIKEIERIHDTLNLYIDGELSGQAPVVAAPAAQEEFVPLETFSQEQTDE